MEEDNIYVRWSNTKKFCRVAFIVSNDDYFVMERDIIWDSNEIYGIKEKDNVEITKEEARKLWKVLCSKHSFYRKKDE